MKKTNFLTFIVLACFALAGISCKKAEEEAASTFSSGDIVISNTGSKSVVLFNSEGKFKKVLYTFAATSGQIPYGVVYNQYMESLMILTDGIADKVLSIKKSDGSVQENFIQDLNLNSATANSVRGITQLTSGDLLIAETSAIERFSYSGIRITSDSASGAWPKTAGVILTTVMNQLAALPSNGVVACSTGSDVVRTYNNAMAQVGSVVSGIAATTDVVGCAADSSGAVYAAFNGTTDTIRKYSSSSLGTTSWSYSNLSLLANPSGLAISANGTVLAIDATNNSVIEINSTGTTGAPLGGSGSDINSMLSTPNHIYVIP